jgi:16S rRNA (uracil1498-N3)-methyltransferase
MKRLVVDDLNLAGDTAILAGGAHHHIATVLRLAESDPLLLCDGQGLEVDARIERVNQRDTLVRLLARRHVPPPPAPALMLLYGIAKGTRTETVIQKATELGVAYIIPAVCDRSVARPASPGKKQGRWQEIALQAARQSGRAYLPQIAPPMPFGAALHEASAAEIKLIASPSGRSFAEFGSALQSRPQRACLAVGPEGGFTADELGRAKDAGFQAVSLGPLILRTETAALAIVVIAAQLAGLLEPPPSQQTSIE